MSSRYAPRHLATLVAVALAVALVPHASAHEQPYTFLDLQLAPGRISGSLTAHVFDLAHEIGVATPDTLLDPAVASMRADTMRAVLGRGLILVADGDTLRPRWTGVEIDRERNGLTFRFEIEWAVLPAALEIETHFFPYDPGHETYVNVSENGALRHQDLLDRERSRVTVYGDTRQGIWAVIRTFVAAGIHHIFIGPDHILFIIGLLLPGGGIVRLLKIVTGFTIAHSFTLALATFQILDPPGTLIEPAIALSIVTVGLDNLRLRAGGRDHRAWMAFGFGFIHGFGFASVLRDFGLPAQALGWSLFSFNLGVEIGQACIVGAVTPALATLNRRWPASGRALLEAGSAVVVLAGAWWFVERVFLSR